MTVYDKIGGMLISALFCVLAIKVIYEGAEYLYEFVRGKRKGISVKGRVTKLEYINTKFSSRDGTVPHLSFRTDHMKVSGIPVNAVPCKYSFYKIGQKYDLYYDPANPEMFIIIKWTEWCCGIAVLLFGLTLLAFCICVIAIKFFP